MCDLSIVLVPGAFELPDFFAPIVQAVTLKGHEIQTVHLPTVPSFNSTLGTPPTMSDDATYISEVIEHLADQEKDVLLLSHSYGGVPATESVRGLSKKARKKKGKKGGVVHLGYMTALVPEAGQSASGVLANGPAAPPGDYISDELGWLSQDNTTLNAGIVYSDLPPAEGQAWMGRYYRHSAVSLEGNLTYAGYRDVPVSYLLCEGDLVIPPETQRSEIAMIERLTRKKVDVTNIGTGHVPYVSQPQLVIDWILKTARKASA